MKISTINRFFNILFGSMAMALVALVSAFISMRLAIHGREVKVPALTGLTISDASRAASHLGLSLTLENRFYSPQTPPGLVLAQYPAPGATVRRDWAIRITESLGPQQVAIPNLIGQTERTASINIRHIGLDTGIIAQLPSAGPAGIVIAQTPTPNASAVASPRVSLLLSAPEDAASAPAYVMPALGGLTLAGAVARTAPIGLHIVSMEDISAPASPSPQPGVPIQPIHATITTVVGQSPAPGHRVVRGDAVHLTMAAQPAKPQ